MANQGFTLPLSSRRKRVSYTFPVRASVTPWPPPPVLDRLVGSYREPTLMVAALESLPLAPSAALGPAQAHMHIMAIASVAAVGMRRDRFMRNSFSLCSQF